MSVKQEGMRIIEETKYDSGTLTIEKRLHLYESHPDKSARSAVMWHAWNQNKSWLSRLLELTLASFPSYSRHDASHAEAVLHNIERILGESRIRELSATDCFAILHTVYIHDIGMAILAADRRKIVKSDDFIEMIDELAEGVDSDLRDAALQLKKWCYGGQSDDPNEDKEGLDYHRKKGDLYEEKLETYYAIVSLVANYQRKYHGEKAASSVRDWLSEPGKLGTEFAMSGIPMRIFLRIADCAKLHTDWEFEHIMELPQEENGYEKDMMHPRFVAVLLQLGDALDIDNDRFHPFAEAFLGEFPDDSQPHYDKHLSIRTLKITPEEILIEADCRTRDALRIVKTECDNLEKLLKSASYKWTNIAPKGFSGALPSFCLKTLRLGGIEIPSDLATTRFRISQAKAFSLLQGRNIYSDEFPFVRELLQNAIDSTKLQCYNDYKTSSKFRYRKAGDRSKIPSITNISDIINPVEYPIKISMECCKQKKGSPVESVPFDAVPSREEEGEHYGILFSIEDYGTGINSDAIRAISNVGSSYRGRRALLREMPDWLRPTGEFGIGLQSVFLVSDRFTCETYVRNGERYQIEFQTGAKGEKGYINVNPVDPQKVPMAFGTKFQVFIPHEKRKEHKNRTSIGAPSGARSDEEADTLCRYDPFADSYRDSEIKRNIAALTTQILVDIDSQLGDLLFPVYANVSFDMKNKENLRKQLHSIVLDVDGKDEHYEEENLREHICWMYYRKNEKEEEEKENRFRVQIEEDHFLVDLEQMKIYMWLEKISCVACVGMEHFMQDNAFSRPAWCDVFYKGILLERYRILSGESLVEYIDILGGQNGRGLIQLSRDGLTQEGRAYIRDEVLPVIDRQLLRVLKKMASGMDWKNAEGEKCSFSGKIAEVFGHLLEEIAAGKKRQLTDGATAGRKEAPTNGTVAHEGGRHREWKQMFLGISLFYNFYKREVSSEHREFTPKVFLEEENQWQNALQEVTELATEYCESEEKSENYVSLTGIFSVTETYISYKENEFRLLGTRKLMLSDILNRRNKFLVVSQRRTKGDKWANSLVLLSAEKTQAKESGDAKRMPEIIRDLEDEYGKKQDTDSIRENMENWGDFLLSRFTSENLIVKDSDRIQWLMGNVTVHAVFMSDDGNYKIHVLSGSKDKGVYYNRNGKYRLLRAIRERNQKYGGERFAGNIWRGFEYLGVKHYPEDVCCLKEAYMRQNLFYMAFPCTGKAVASILKFANHPDEPESIIIADEKAGEIEISIRDLRYRLSEIGDVIYRCLANVAPETESELKQVRNAYEENQVGSGEQMSMKSYVDKMGMSYRFYLQWIHVSRLLSKDTIPAESLNVDEFSDKLGFLEGQEAELEQLRGDVFSEVYHNAQYLETGNWAGAQSHSQTLELNAKKLLDYAQLWKDLWNYLVDFEMESSFDMIRREYWDNAAEKKNLIRWMTEQEKKDEKAVEECYGLVWEELKDMAVHRRGQAVRMTMYHHDLAEWLENLKNGIELM